MFTRPGRSLAAVMLMACLWLVVSSTVLGAAGPKGLVGDKPRISVRLLLSKIGRDKPVPLIVEVANPTADNYDSMRIRVAGDGTTPNYTQDLTLPANTSKRYFMALRGSFRYSTEVVLEYNGTTIDTAQVSIPRSYNSLYSILAVAPTGEQSGLTYLLDVFKSKNNSGSSNTGDEVTIDYIDAESLPDKCSVYEGCDLLILKNPNLDKASNRQLEALADWVYRGGHAVICPDPNFAQFNQNMLYKLLLGFEVTGLVPLSSADVFTRTYGGQISQGSLQALSTRHGSTVRTLLAAPEGNHELILARGYGQGSVALLTFFPFAPPLNTWSQPGDMWRKLVDELTAQSGEDVFGNPTIDVDQLFGGFKVDDLPSAALPLVYLAVYFIVLLPINYYILWSRSQEKLAWLTIPAIVLAFTFVGEAFGWLYRNSEGGVHEIHLVHHPAPQQAYGRVDMHLFSINKAEYTVKSPFSSDDLTVNDPSGGYHRSGAQRTQLAKMTMSTGDKMVIDGIFLSNWDKILFKGTYSQRSPNPDWVFQPDPVGAAANVLGGQLTWSSKDTLAAPVLIARDGGVVRVFEHKGVIKPDQTVSGADFQRISRPEITVDAIFGSGAATMNQEQRKTVKDLYNGIVSRLRHNGRNYLVGVVFLTGRGRYGVTPRPGNQTSTEIHVLSL